MEDQLISFETAKLAKEKGCDIPSVLVMYHPSKIKNGFEIKGKYTKRTYKDYYKNVSGDRIERIHIISQTSLQKWLREKHNIHINIHWSEKGYIVFEKAHELDNTHWYETYEEALEAGLYEALKLIKNV